MLQLTSHMKLLLAIESADFRKGIDALVGLCQQHLKYNPFSGCVFAFRNKNKNAVKLLTYDGTGFWLCLKRFSQGKLKWWPASKEITCTLSPTELQILLNQGNPTDLRLSESWRPISFQNH